MTLSSINHTISELQNMIAMNWDMFDSTMNAKRNVEDLMRYDEGKEHYDLYDAARKQAARLDMQLRQIEQARKDILKELRVMNNFQAAALVAFQKENQDLRNFKASL